MGVLSNFTIASRGVFVKGTLPGNRRETQSHSGLNLPCRPDVLSKMPRSCNLVFDVLRSMIDSNGQSQASVRYLAQVTGLGTTAVWRALRRLRGAHLINIATDSRGARGTIWQLRWRSPLSSFPQFTVPPPPTYRPRDKAFSPNGTDRPLSDTNARGLPNGRSSQMGVDAGAGPPAIAKTRPSPRALRWAAAEIRRAVRTFPIDEPRRRLYVNTAMTALHRGVQVGRIQPGPQLGQVVARLCSELVEMRGGRPARQLYAWAAAVVAEVVKEIAQAEASEELFHQIERERREAMEHPLGELLAEAGVEHVSDYVRRLVETDETDSNRDRNRTNCGKLKGSRMVQKCRTCLCPRREHDSRGTVVSHHIAPFLECRNPIETGSGQQGSTIPCKCTIRGAETDHETDHNGHCSVRLFETVRGG